VAALVHHPGAHAHAMLIVREVVVLLLPHMLCRVLTSMRWWWMSYSMFMSEDRESNVGKGPEAQKEDRAKKLQHP